MRKLLFLLLLPAFFTAKIVVSTEQDVKLTAKQQYEITSTVYSNYYTDLPTNPNVYEQIPTYTSLKLEKVAGNLTPNTSIKLSELQVNEQGIPVFKLADGKFVPADKRMIYDDVVQSSTAVSQTMWLKPSFVVYNQAFVTGTKEIKTNLLPYHSVKITQLAETISGKYAYVEEKGWIDMKYLSDTDNRMDKVQEILTSKYNKADYSIYVKQLGSGKTAGINPDLEMYSASVAKLPILYYAQKQLNEGKYSLSSGLKYIPAVNDYLGAYNTEGSGSISKKADNNHYSIQNLINHIAKESDNAATNILGYYITNQSDSTYQTTIEQIAGKKWDVEKRNASAKMAGNVMEAIYEQNGDIINALSQTNFDAQRISKNINVKVAHKIGDAYDFKHDVAIVYATSPFILSIFTNNSDYDTISQIADDIYEVLK